VDRQRSVAAAMLGLPGFVVLAVSEVDGELEQAIETTADLVPCPECGAVAELHDRRPCWVRDLPVSGRPVMLVWIKRIWRCPHRLCPKRTWTETSPVIAPRASLTERARAEICRRVGEDAASVAAVAREFGIGWRTAMIAVREHGTPRVDDPTRLAGVKALRLDETAFQAASATRSTSFVTGIVDLTRRWGSSARLLDVVDDRSASALVYWVNQGHCGWRAGIGVAALDPYRGYAWALRASMPQAVRVLDALHGAFGVCCRRSGALPHPAAADRAPRPHRRPTVMASLGCCAARPTTTPTGPVTAAKRTGRRRHRRRTARPHLDRRPKTAADLPLPRPRPRPGAPVPVADLLRRRRHPRTHRLAATLDSWRAELLAYFDTGGISNGPTKAINLLTKKIKRIGHGFRNFDNYRLRLLLHYGVDWDTIRATSIRGRLPRLVA
jgi:transposase